MTKFEFFGALESHLSPMSPEERTARLDYYHELFDDMLEEGMSEEEVCARLGDPAEIARELLRDLPLTTLIRSRVKSGREKAKNGWQTFLNVLGAPLWLVLLLSAALVLVSVYLSVWAVILSLFVAFVSGVLAAVLVALNAAAGIGGLLIVGAALVAAGLCIGGFVLMIWVSKWIIRFTKYLIRKIKGLFI